MNPLFFQFFFSFFLLLRFDIIKIFWQIVGTTFKVVPDGPSMGHVKRNPCFVESKWSQD